MIEYLEGDYEIIYSVKDRAENKTTFSLPLTITSKYDPTEKNRLLSASKAYKAFLENNKLTNLYISNIPSTSSGNMILILFVDERIIYYSESEVFENLPEYSPYPSDFNDNSEYSEEDINDFIEYYHLFN